LTEDQIVAGALRLAAAARLDNVSMRALAQELGVPVMTIYNYVPNKDALYELVVNHALGQVRVPAPDEGSWEERLKQLERDARSALARLPGLSFDRRDSAEGARLAEGVLSILADAGFDATESALAFTTLFTFMVGQIDVDVDVAEAGGAAAQAVHAASQATKLSRDDIFEFGFDAVIEGLKLKLESGRPAPSHRQRSRESRRH
jgi:AcrR family transcriptional regulator